jgi:transketolase
MGLPPLSKISDSLVTLAQLFGFVFEGRLKIGVNQNKTMKKTILSDQKHSLAKLAQDIRVDVLRMVNRSKASHIGSCYSIVDVLATLYGCVLKIDRDDPNWCNRDRFIMSKGHAAAALYATLANVGIIDKSDLKTYGVDGSLYMTHVSHKIKGVEFSTGSLGHGLPFGVGKALVASRQLKSWRVFVQLSDGEMDEGSNWEAMMFAAHHKLDNLVAIIDYNKIQSLGTTSNTLELEPLGDKLRAFGWAVREIDGHNHEALLGDLGTVPWVKGKPSMLIANTIKGKGISFMENKVKWHYKSPDDKEMAAGLAELEVVYA